jgi:hypothetical protein
VRRLALGLLLVLELELADELEEPLLLLLRFLPLEPLEVLEEPFLLVDLLAFERLRVDRLLEDRVVWAMVNRLSWLPCQLRLFAPAVHWTYPLSSEFERSPARVFERRDSGKQEPFRRKSSSGSCRSRSSS